MPPPLRSFCDLNNELIIQYFMNVDVLNFHSRNK